jgi:hypothetical protein
MSRGGNITGTSSVSARWPRAAIAVGLGEPHGGHEGVIPDPSSLMHHRTAWSYPGLAEVDGTVLGQIRLALRRAEWSMSS